MPYATPKDMLKKAQKENYAVVAINIENMEMAQAAIQAAEELKSPIILQTTSSTLDYAPPSVFCGIIKPLANQSAVPVALCLDHVNDYNLVMRCIKAGYVGVMVDASSTSVEENTTLTKSVAGLAQNTAVLVEGRISKEITDQNGVADIAKIKEYVDRTNISALTISTVSKEQGIYTDTPTIDKSHLADIHKNINLPLVLHGVYGVDNEIITDCIKLGVCKVNYAIEVKIAYTDGVNAYMKKNPNAFDPKKYGTYGREFVKTMVKEKIEICGSAGKC